MGMAARDTLLAGFAEFLMLGRGDELNLAWGAMARGGTMWRLRALVAMGHTCSRMAAATGIPPATLRRIVRGDALTVSPALRQEVTVLFDAWWDKTPPQRTRQEKLASHSALKRAALNNWPCPAGLDEDELDQPGYLPQCDWRYARGTTVADDYPFAERRAAS